MADKKGDKKEKKDSEKKKDKDTDKDKDKDEKKKPFLAMEMGPDNRDNAIMGLFILNFVGIIVAIMLLFISMFMHIALKAHIEFLADFYNSATLPMFLSILGAIQFFHCFLGFKIVWDSKNMSEKIKERDEDPEKGGAKSDKSDKSTKSTEATDETEEETEETDDTDKKKKKKGKDKKEKITISNDIFTVYIILALFITFLILVAIIFSFMEIFALEAAFGKALSKAMDNYKTEVTDKKQIDNLQMEYKCCGIEKFEDWFKISFIDKKFVHTEVWKAKMKVKDGEYITNDVPFSCCDPKIIGDCLTDNIVVDKSTTGKSNITVYKRGCREILMEFYGDKLLTGVGIFVSITIFIWIFMAILARFLQTALKEISNGEKDPVSGKLF